MTKLCTINVKFDDVKKINIYKTNKLGEKEYCIKVLKYNYDSEPLYNDNIYRSLSELRDILFEPVIDKNNKICGPFISLNNKLATIANLIL